MKNSIKEFILMELIKLEQDSTCAAKAVACIILKNDTIIATGYNSSVSEMKCKDIFKKVNGLWFYRDYKSWIEYLNDLNNQNISKEWLQDDTGLRHKTWSVYHEVHAEIMALTNLSHIAGTNYEAIVTYTPCIDCCKSLINAGIKKITYIHKYDNFENIQELCKECNIELKRMEDDMLETYYSCRKHFT